KDINIDVWVRMHEIAGQAASMVGSGFDALNWRRWGGIDHYAKGGIRKYAKGGTRGRQAMLGSGKNMVWWDEPETGGEAYIPRLGNKHRSRGILETAASWYGMRVVPMQQGGIRMSPYRPNVTSTSTRATHFHGGINVTEQQLGVTQGEVVQIARQAVRDEFREQR
ncbi:MAG TPA: hypothetical protein VK054_08595, partial [Beutenbergiaceae bacterium]|nr:hypothetical protein [Beutenbergiaceae bacterium]